MRNERRYYVYIITSKRNSVLYTGVTGDLICRVFQHRSKYNPRSFSARYNVYKLVYYEEFDNPYEAIMREKQIKAGSRRKKIKLIESMNPKWKDLSEGWF